MQAEKIQKLKNNIKEIDAALDWELCFKRIKGCVNILVKYNETMKRYFAEVVEQQNLAERLEGQQIGTGSTATEAVGALVWGMPELFGIHKIRFDKKEIEEKNEGEQQFRAEFS